MQRLRALVYSQIGQTTAEYALVLLIAGLVVGVFGGVVKSGAMRDVFERLISNIGQHAQV
jgi:Flp pilus assembly pilin Flp